jgi:hypothetical protein
LISHSRRYRQQHLLGVLLAVNQEPMVIHWLLGKHRWVTANTCT